MFFAHFCARGLADLSSLVAQVHPVRRGEVHRLRHAVTAAHFGDKGTGVADHELAAPLHRAVNLDAFAAQHLRRDLEGRVGVGKQKTLEAVVERWCISIVSLKTGSESGELKKNNPPLTMMFFSSISSPGVPLACSSV